jgi:hypothetical protein
MRMPRGCGLYRMLNDLCRSVFEVSFDISVTSMFYETTVLAWLLGHN